MRQGAPSETTLSLMISICLESGPLAFVKTTISMK